MAGSSTGRPDRDQDQVEADVAASRDRLVTAVEALVDRVHPQRIKQREVAAAKRLARTELENLKLLVFNAAGDPRSDRLAKIGGGAAGFLGLLLVLRAAVRRSRKGSAGQKSKARPEEQVEAGRKGSAGQKSKARPEEQVETGRRVSRRAARARAKSAPPALDDVEARVRRARTKA